MFCPPFMCSIPPREEQQGRFLYVCGVCVRSGGAGMNIENKANNRLMDCDVQRLHVSISSHTLDGNTGLLHSASTGVRGAEWGTQVIVASNTFKSVIL